MGPHGELAQISEYPLTPGSTSHLLPSLPFPFPPHHQSTEEQSQCTGFVGKVGFALAGEAVVMGHDFGTYDRNKKKATLQVSRT